MKKRDWIIISGIIVGGVVIAFFINWSLTYGNLIKTNLSIDSWLSFWGSYCGGIFAAIVGYLAIIYSNRNSEKAIHQQEKQLIHQRLVKKLDEYNDCLKNNLELLNIVDIMGITVGIDYQNLSLAKKDVCRKKAQIYATDLQYRYVFEVDVPRAKTDLEVQYDKAWVNSLYKFFNDKFGYEAKRDKMYGERLSKAEKWDAEYDTFTEEEVEDLFSYLPASVPRLKPEHTLSHLYNFTGKGDFSTLLDATLIDIANINADTFSVTTSGKSKVNIFSAITTFVTDQQKRDEFAKSLMRNVASFNFEHVFIEKYDFFSRIFEHLLKGFNNAGGGKYAEYYTPRAIAQVMARLLVGDNADLRGVTCYDPSAGTGTLLMALAHQIGEDRCSIYSQDIVKCCV